MRSLVALLAIIGCGGEVPRPARPERIVSLSVVTDEIVLSLVTRERVAGVSIYASDPVRCRVAELAKGLPAAPRDDADAILALRPDLVLLSTRASKEMERLLTGAKVAVVRVPTPKDLEDIRESVRAVARAVGEKERGDVLLHEMDGKLAEIERRPGCGLVALYLTPGGWTSGRSTNVDVILKYAGLRNAAEEVEGHREMPLEWVLEKDPDLMLIGEGYREFEGWRETLRRDPRYAPLKAVKGNRVIVLPARSFFTISHFIADAAAEVREELSRRGIGNE